MTPVESNGTPDVIEVERLERRFGAHCVLDEVSLQVPRGTVFGLVGKNGVGKTTLIRHILGLLRPERGTVRVFGRDPVADPVGVLSRTGYLSEKRDLPGWMRIDELLRYTKAFYPRWDDAYAEELRQTFGLDSAARVRTLSLGQRARTGLLLALAHRPELLVLDEPSSGLDPVVRRDILSAIIRTIAEEGRTVLFSSHLLDEVEQVADHLAILAGGQMVLQGTLEEIKETHHRVVVRFDEPRPGFPTIEGVLDCTGWEREWTVHHQGRLQRLESDLTPLGGRIVEKQIPTVDEIFVAHMTAQDRSEKEAIR